jgi:hypothetical protein
VPGRLGTAAARWNYGGLSNLSGERGFRGGSGGPEPPISYPLRHVVSCPGPALNPIEREENEPIFMHSRIATVVPPP